MESGFEIRKRHYQIAGCEGCPLKDGPFVQNKAACSAMHSSESFFTLPTIGETG